VGRKRGEGSVGWGYRPPCACALLLLDNAWGSRTAAKNVLLSSFGTICFESWGNKSAHGHPETRHVVRHPDAEGPSVDPLMSVESGRQRRWCEGQSDTCIAQLMSNVTLSTRRRA
jgi:hypothetical protein